MLLSPILVTKKNTQTTFVSPSKNTDGKEKNKSNNTGNGKDFSVTCKMQQEVGRSTSFCSYSI